MIHYLKPLIIVLFIIYPFIIYYGLINYALWQIAVLVALLAGLRAFIFKNHHSPLAKASFYASLCLIAFSLLSVLLNEKGWLKLYPIIVSLLFFGVFFSSLFKEKTIIQRFAEIRQEKTDVKKQKYLYQLTIIWCVFFVINAIISIYTMSLSFQNWALYNGFISYLIIGGLMALELVYRHLILLRK